MMNTNIELINNRTLCDIQADFCSVFTNPIRIRIMLALGENELSVGEIAEKLNIDITMPNLSQHLRLMKDRLCLCCRKDGKNVYYRVTSPLFLEAMSLIRSGIKEAERTRLQ
jgi:ArsR family transcriptional regulator